jgi:hypothetical protein
MAIEHVLYVAAIQEVAEIAAAVVADGQHGAQISTDAKTPKILRIREIDDAGFKVESMIVRHGLASSKHAYDVEAALIDALGMSRPGTLLNAVFGHHRSTRGLVNSAVVTSLFDAPQAPEITEPTICFASRSSGRHR